jgi:hypothetical protein
MKKADASGAAVAVVIGDDEAQANEVSVKPMQGGEQQRVSVQTLAATLTGLSVGVNHGAWTQEQEQLDTLKAWWKERQPVARRSVDRRRRDGWLARLAVLPAQSIQPGRHAVCGIRQATGRE